MEIRIRHRDATQSLDSLSRDLERYVSAEISQFADNVVDDARIHHRFTTRTGRLRSAVRQITKQYSTSVLIDDARAPYGKFIHSGFKSWAPDPFVEDAFEARKLEDAIERGIDNAIRVNGLD